MSALKGREIGEDWADDCVYEREFFGFGLLLCLTCYE